MKQIRKRLTYANVMSSIAVFLILGGATAIAAIKKVGANEIKANSIKTGKIVKEAVTAGKLKNGSVTNAKIADNAVSGAKVEDGSLTGSDLKLDTVGTVPKANLANTAETAKVAGTAFAQESGSNILAFNTSANSPTTVASLNVPGGNYLISGKVLANNNSAALVSVRCELLAGATVVDQGFEVVRLPAEGAADRQFLVVSGIATLPAGGSINVNCRSSTTEGNWLNRVLTAYQVSALK